VRVPEATASAAHDHHALLARDDIGDQVATLRVKDCSTRRDANL
jgi:hypothetical protein